MLAAAAAVALVGCGGAKDARRHDVNRYVDQVNRIELHAAPAWQRAQVAYQKLGSGQLTTKKLRELAAAPAAIRQLRRRVAAVDVPPAAAALRTSLLRLLDAEASFADEVARFGNYTVKVAKLEAELGADTRALSKALARSRRGAEQEQVLKHFATQVAGLEQRISLLDPPQALAPWDREQRARLRTLRAGANELASSLARGDRVSAGHGLTQIRNATSQSPVTTADHAAVAAYDARLAQLRKLAADVARRRDALTREYS